MFSSITSFLFGSNQSATTDSEVNQNPTGQPSIDDDSLRIDAEHTIEVSSLTPSVAGTTLTTSGALRQGKRGKNRRNRSNKNKKPTPIPTITKLLTPSESFDQEIDEDDWFIVEKEAEEESLPRTDSEEESSLVEVKPRAAAAPAPPNVNQAAQLPPTQQRRHPHINSHSLYSGPRPQQQRNYLQRARNGGERGAHFSVSTLSPPRSIASAGAGSVASVGAAAAAAAIADGGVTQSLYVVSSNREALNNSGGSNAIGANVSMEESWFVTPPPCFTSIGPINMETSPFENLLIEHPSMSVYYSIKTAQEAAETESFVNRDLGAEDSQQGRVVAPQAAAAQGGRIAQAAQARAPGPRIDHYTAAQLKQELLARTSQRSHDKKQRQSLCRGAMKRSNQVRDFQSKGQRQRRADMQHCKVVSGANNNRKCCF